MTTVIRRRTPARASAHTTARDMRALMRRQQVTPGALAWILNVNHARAFRLRYYASDWMIDEVMALIDACAPVSAAVSGWGAFAEATA